VGECVQHRNATTALVAPLWEQARVCAAHLAASAHLRYTGSVVSTSLKVTASAVLRRQLGRREGCEVLILRDPEAASTSASAEGQPRGRALLTATRATAPGT